MIYSISSDKLYTIWIEDEFKGEKIYDVEFLSFDEEIAQKHLEERTKEIPSAKFSMRVFSVGGMRKLSGETYYKAVGIAKVLEEEEEKERMAYWEAHPQEYMDACVWG
mgnify:CR=1 FL=1